MCIYFVTMHQGNLYYILLINAPLDHERKANENIFVLTKMLFVMYFGKRADKGTQKMGWIEVKI